MFVYDIKCPDISERNLTAKGFCSRHSSDRHTSDRYACLYDVNGLKHVESCNRIADYSSPGKTNLLAAISEQSDQYSVKTILS